MHRRLQKSLLALSCHVVSQTGQLVRTRKLANRYCSIMTNFATSHGMLFCACVSNMLVVCQASTELDAEVKKLSAERQRLAAEVQLKREIEQQYAKRCTLQARLVQCICRTHFPRRHKLNQQPSILNIATY